MVSTLRNQQTSLQNIENQVGQIAKVLAERPPGSLRSNTKTNPREHMKTITLRNGREIESRPGKTKQGEETTIMLEKQSKGQEKEWDVVLIYKPRICYPVQL